MQNKSKNSKYVFTVGRGKCRLELGENFTIFLLNEWHTCAKEMTASRPSCTKTISPEGNFRSISKSNLFKIQLNMDELYFGYWC